MPKLIIPNVHELYKLPNEKISASFAHSRYAYNLRFLWLMQPGDAIILPGAPDPAFMDYLTKVLQFDLHKLNVILWEDAMNAEFDKAMSNPMLIQRLRQYIDKGTGWSIQTCYFSKAVEQLAHSLGIKITPQLEHLIRTNSIQLLNSKSEFRRLAGQNHIPIAPGATVHSAGELANAIKTLVRQSDQLIVKQNLDGGGRGNTIVSTKANLPYCGAQNTIVLNDNVDVIARQLWHRYGRNSSLVVESYCQNNGTFTANIFIPSNGGKPQLLQYSRIRLDKTWFGVEVPAHGLPPDRKEQLINYAITLALKVQATGYNGFICCDAVNTDSGLVFTEINVRPGAETHSHFLASHLFGQDYLNTRMLLTRRGLKVDCSFKSLLALLDSKGLLLKPESNSGVAILTFHEQFRTDVEILVAAADYQQAQSIEEEVITQSAYLNHEIERA